MAGRVKPLIIVVVILFTFMITIAYGIEITREEPLEREAIWLELIEPKITPYYVNVWDPDFNVSVAAHTSGPVASSIRDAEDDIPGEPVLVKNYMDIVVAIHPPDTPGHYSFEVTPDYPENQLIVDSVNPGRATFRTAVFGEFSITPKFHTTDGKVIFLAQGSVFPDPTSKSIPTEAYSLKVSDECEANVRKVDCLHEGTNQHCKNIFGVGEQITFFRFQKSATAFETALCANVDETLPLC